MKTFKHSGKIGDVIASIPCSRLLGGGECHYLLDTTGELSKDAAKSLSKLLEKQEGITASIWKGEVPDYDLNLFRHACYPLDRGDLRKWYSYIFDVYPELHVPWLKVKPDKRYYKGFEKAVVVNRTTRYRSPHINYKFLQDKVFERVVFLGTKQEYIFFKGEVRRAEWVACLNHYHAGRIISCSKLFIGNQSSLWWVAEALGHKRLLEVYCPAPNCIPLTPNGCDSIYGPGFEKIARRLYGADSEGHQTSD